MSRSSAHAGGRRAPPAPLGEPVKVVCAAGPSRTRGRSGDLIPAANPVAFPSFSFSWVPRVPGVPPSKYPQQSAVFWMSRMEPVTGSTRVPRVPSGSAARVVEPLWNPPRGSKSEPEKPQSAADFGVVEPAEPVEPAKMDKSEMRAASRRRASLAIGGVLTQDGARHPIEPQAVVLAWNTHRIGEMAPGAAHQHSPLGQHPRDAAGIEPAAHLTAPNLRQDEVFPLFLCVLSPPPGTIDDGAQLHDLLPRFRLPNHRLKPGAAVQGDIAAHHLQRLYVLGRICSAARRKPACKAGAGSAHRLALRPGQHAIGGRQLAGRADQGKPRGDGSYLAVRIRWDMSGQEPIAGGAQCRCQRLGIVGPITCELIEIYR